MPTTQSGSFTMTINACQTSVNYDASSGARCKDQASGNWYVRNVTHTKAANLRLINTHSLAEVFINSDGVPTLGEGNADCRTQTIGSRSGLSCKMVNYTLQTNGLSNTSTHIFPRSPTRRWPRPSGRTICSSASTAAPGSR